MSWDDANLERPPAAPTDHRERLAALVGSLDPDEARLLLMLVERILSRRPDPDRLEVDVPRDAGGDVTAAVQGAVDSSLTAAAALIAVRRKLT